MFHSWKCIWQFRLRNGGHFVQGGDELISFEAISYIPVYYNSSGINNIRQTASYRKCNQANNRFKIVL